jgi:hypothetical protein
MDVADHGVVLSIGSGRNVDALSRRLFRYLETHCMQLTRRNSGRLNFFVNSVFIYILSFSNALTLPEFQNIYEEQLETKQNITGFYEL